MAVPLVRQLLRSPVLRLAMAAMAPLLRPFTAPAPTRPGPTVVHEVTRDVAARTWGRERRSPFQQAASLAAGLFAGGVVQLRQTVARRTSEQ
eukprot:Skav217929  [mRNA]  locus=scaffold2633:194123:195966:- [translate_table: standard]